MCRSSFFCLLALLLWLPAQSADEWAGAARSRELRAERLPAPFETLKALHTPLQPPGPGDWLAQHPERGQSLAQYRRQQARPDARLTTIYILPLGDFTPEQRRIVDLTARFLEIYYGTPVKRLPTLALDAIPARARRTVGDDEQLLTRHILDNLLLPRRPADALACLALTASDLWPGEGWNFVYGQASLRDRVGVWSLHRNGDPSASTEAFALCLRRTLQTASHETGHLVGIRHCLAYECNLNGANHRAEADSRPLALCPACLAKLDYRLDLDLANRFQRLVVFCHRHHLKADSKLFARSMVALPD